MRRKRVRVSWSKTDLIPSVEVRAKTPEKLFFDKNTTRSTESKSDNSNAPKPIGAGFRLDRCGRVARKLKTSALFKKLVCTNRILDANFRD